MPLPAIIGAGIGAAIRYGPRILSALGVAKSTADNYTPQLEDEATVEVIGQPGSNKKDLYYLAMAAACGLVRRYDFLRAIFPPIGMVMIEYDAADCWVRAVVRYKTSLLSAVVARPLKSVLAPDASTQPLFQKAQAYLNSFLQPDGKPTPDLAEAAIFSGPSPVLVGKSWNFTGLLGVGLPNTSQSRGAPVLPYDGRTILTTADATSDAPTNPGVALNNGVIPQSSVQGSQMNPKPPGDYRSRGAVSEMVGSQGALQSNWNGNVIADLLVPLVYSALSNPGSIDQVVFSSPNRNSG